MGGTSQAQILQRMDRQTNVSKGEVAVVARKEAKARPDKTFRFMDLPKDVRLMVYDYLLTPGEIYTRWSPRDVARDLRCAAFTDEGEPSSPGAEVQLFRVSRTIMEEAMPQYIMNNKFVMVWTQLRIPAVLPTFHLRQLSIAFDERALDLNTAMFELEWNQAAEMRDHPDWTETDWPLTLPEKLQETLVKTCWEELVRQVHGLKLKRLEVNLQHCYSPLGRHRLIEKAVGPLCEWPAEACPRVIRFLGTNSVAERKTCKTLVDGAKHGGKHGPKVEFAGVFSGLHREHRWPIWSDINVLHVDSDDAA